jgi:hypothetical protein
MMVMVEELATAPPPRGCCWRGAGWWVGVAAACLAIVALLCYGRNCSATRR